MYQTKRVATLSSLSYYPNIPTVIAGKRANGKIQKYKMVLEIVTLTHEDLESKMFLIKDYRLIISIKPLLHTILSES